MKIEPNGAAGRRVRDFSAGDRVDVSLPRGSFTLVDDTRPVVLLSAGIGVTPVLAMLYALADVRSARQILWLHQARDGQHHAFGDEVRRLMSVLARGRSHVCYSRPASTDQLGKDFDSVGHLSLSPRSTASAFRPMRTSIYAARRAS